MFKYLATMNAGVDHVSAMELACKANVQAVLTCKELGGRDDWDLEKFLSSDPWDELGGKAGIKEQAKELLTVIAAAGRKWQGQPAPINPYCSVCRALKFMHMGARCNLVPIPCLCGDPDAEVQFEQEKREATEVKSTAAATEAGKTHPKAPKSHAKRSCGERGFSAELDPMCHGMCETYERKCHQLDVRFGEDATLKVVVQQLLGRTITAIAEDSDDEDTGGAASSSAGVTGEQGGRLLACAVLRAEMAASASFLTKAGGALAWLQQQLPNASAHPAAKLCLEKAVAFLPKLKAARAKNKAAKRATTSAATPISLDFGDE